MVIVRSSQLEAATISDIPETHFPRVAASDDRIATALRHAADRTAVPHQHHAGGHLPIPDCHYNTRHKLFIYSYAV